MTAKELIETNRVTTAAIQQLERARPSADIRLPDNVRILVQYARPEWTQLQSAGEYVSIKLTNLPAIVTAWKELYPEVFA